MIPLKDRNPTRRVPVVNVALIVANVAVFLYEWNLGAQLGPFVARFGMTPGAVTERIGTPEGFLWAPLTLLTSLFIHSGWLHLIGNMLYLWVFGDNVEDKLGHFRYFIFYLVSGVAASALHIALGPGSTVPVVGASGAISGVLGAYIFLFPRARVLTLIPIFIFIQIAELPAYVLLGIWFILQFLSGLLSLGASGTAGGVAWWAHVGGFAAGLILILPFRKYR